ncbi:MAG TPA: methylmalonyl-CoA epimerase [Actinopolymorphaceae bacterium]
MSFEPGAEGNGHSLLRGIDHVGIAVRDLDAAIAFYSETFGMQPVHTEVNHDQDVREAMLRVGESGPLLQLIAPLSEQSPIAKFLETRGEGIHQIAYSVDDVDQVAETLRERGLQLLYERARTGTGGSRVNFVHPKSAGGVLVELVEKPE